MLYGEEKAREIAKPYARGSKTKKFQKARKHRRDRRRVRQHLHNFKEEEDYLDLDLKFDFYEDNISHRKYYWYRDHSWSHFVKWAIEKSKHLPMEQRYGYVLSLILKDDDLARKGASYLRYYEEFSNDIPYRRWWRNQDARPVIHKEQIKTYLKKIVEDKKLHQLLNDYIKTYHRDVTWIKIIKPEEADVPVSWRGPVLKPKSKKEYITQKTKPRLLMGIHDIEHFINDLDRAAKVRTPIKNPDPEVWCGSDSWYRNKNYLPNPKRHSEWKVAAIYFLELWLEFGDSYGKYNENRANYYDIVREYKYKHRWNW